MFAVDLMCVIPAVDEAMRINQKLTSANQRQEAIIVSLKKVSGLCFGQILFV